MEEMPGSGAGGDAKRDTEVVRRQNKARISFATKSEQGPQRVEAPQRPTMESPSTTRDEGDDIGAVGEDAVIGVADGTKISYRAGRTPPRQR